MTGPEIERADGETVHRNRWMTVREDRIRRSDGSEGIYGVVEKLDYASIVPFDGARLHLVEQYRYAVGGRYWEFPRGSREDAPDAGMTNVAGAASVETSDVRRHSNGVVHAESEAENADRTDPPPRAERHARPQRSSRSSTGS